MIEAQSRREPFRQLGSVSHGETVIINEYASTKRIICCLFSESSMESSGWLSAPRTFRRYRRDLPLSERFVTRTWLRDTWPTSYKRRRFRFETNHAHAHGATRFLIDSRSSAGNSFSTRNLRYTIISDISDITIVKHWKWPIRVKWWNKCGFDLAPNNRFGRTGAIKNHRGRGRWGGGWRQFSYFSVTCVCRG